MTSRKHYIAAAALLLEHRASPELARAFADLFAQDNARFDRARFLEACDLAQLEATASTAELEREAAADARYNIVRFIAQSGGRADHRRGLTLADARAHCNRPDTRGGNPSAERAGSTDIEAAR